MLQSSEFLEISLALTLKLLCNLLLQDKRFKGIVALSLGARKTQSKPRSIVLLLVDERRQMAVFALVGLNLDFEILSLFGELLGESLELEELDSC